MLDHQKWFLEASLYHAAKQVTINIYPGFAACVHLAYLCRRCAAEGMPEDSEPCEIKALTPHISRRCVELIEPVHDKDHILRPDCHEPIALLLQVCHVVERASGCCRCNTSIGKDHDIRAIRGSDGKDDVPVAGKVLEQRGVLRRDSAQPRLEDEHGIARRSRGKWGAIKAMGLNGVVALEELLSDEAVLLVGELRPLGRKIGCDLGSGLTQSRIPGPDDQLSLQTGMGSERIVSRLVGPVVLSPADCVGAGRCGQYERLVASDLDEGHTGHADEHEQDQKNPDASFHPWAHNETRKHTVSLRYCCH